MDSQTYVLVLTACLMPNPNDKRDRTTAEYRQWLAELAADIKERGIRNPIRVMRAGDNLVILAGMTRWEAAKFAGLVKVPVIVADRPLSEGEALLETLQENEMRRPMTDRERAACYLELMAKNGWSQAELARQLKKSPPSITRVLAPYVKLPEEIRSKIGSGEGMIPSRAAYALSTIAEKLPDKTLELADRIKNGQLTVEWLEMEIAKLRSNGRKPKEKTAKAKVDGATLIVPGHWTWEKVAELGNRLLRAAKEGAKMPSVPLPAVLQNLLKS